MAASRNYSSTAGLMALVGGLTGAAASLIVNTVTGLPTAPFTLLLDPGEATEEIVEVTAAGGTTLTVTRGVDGTSAQAHANGAEVRHAYSARDFQDSRNHEANTTTAHGVTGAVVGTTNTQTLTNKTLTAPTLTGTTTAGPVNTPAVTAAGATTVTPLTVTMPVSSTVDAVSVVASSGAGSTNNAKTLVGPRGNVTIKAIVDSPAGTDIPALSVQGGVDLLTYRDIQRWLDSGGGTVAKIDAAGKLTAVGAALTGALTGTTATLTGNVTAAGAVLTAPLTGTDATLSGNLTAANIPQRTRGTVTNGVVTGGSIVVTHGLGVVPAIVMTNVNGAYSSFEMTLRTSARTSTTFTVLYFYNGLPTTTTTVSFDWICEA